MLIAVLADTHDKLPDALFDALRPADEIWHLGDVKAPTIITRLQTLNVPVHVVHGNRDNCPDWPAELTLTRHDHTFRLIHIPPRHPGNAGFLLHGHTHVPRDEMLDGTRFLNPGTVGKPNHGAPPSYAWLTVTPTHVDWQIIPL